MAGDAGDMAQEPFVAKSTQIKASDYMFSVPKKGYIPLLRIFNTKAQLSSLEYNDSARKLVDQEAKMGELELKVQLLFDGAGEVGDMRQQLSPKEDVLASAMSMLEAKGATLNTNNSTVTS